MAEKSQSPDGESKKSSKPVMEKRRRARINSSLAELKSLLLEVIKKEGTRHSKMEKADILELTVRHLRQLQKLQLSGLPPNEAPSLNKYRLGFTDCVSEMHKYLSTSSDVDGELRVRLLDHLASYLSGGSGGSQSGSHLGSRVSSKPTTATQAAGPYPETIYVNQLARPLTIDADRSHSNMAAVPMLPKPPNGVSVAQPGVPVTVSSSTDVRFSNSLHILPTKLPGGEMAFVLPAGVPVISGSTIPSYVIPVFTAPEVVPAPVLGAQNSVPNEPNADSRNSAISVLPTQRAGVTSPNSSPPVSTAGALLMPLAPRPVHATKLISGTVTTEPDSTESGSCDTSSATQLPIPYSAQPQTPCNSSTLAQPEVQPPEIRFEQRPGPEEVAPPGPGPATLDAMWRPW